MKWKNSREYNMYLYENKIFISWKIIDWHNLETVKNSIFKWL